MSNGIATLSKVQQSHLKSTPTYRKWALYSGLVSGKQTVDEPAATIASLLEQATRMKFIL
jgi:hypothetical protein